ncbi:C39 family peptidase [Sporolactobacillus pectinivorans]|uniref:C39 family peptidase n=1 Tax=Sporolactobacillus pectinivorans TaxID=1591408 RepID=UPI000C2636E8|nr:C39 family peptidase [Sporolactobacillus pectinivorans]
MNSKLKSAVLMFLILLCSSLLLTHLLVKEYDAVAKAENTRTGNLKRVAVSSERPKQKQKQQIPRKKPLVKKQAKSLPDEAHLSEPFVSQEPELPNGCEIASLTMLLRSAGIPANKMILANQIPKVPFSSGGYMGNPNDGFVGNMYHGPSDDPGLAVYHGPVAGLASKYLGNRVEDLTGCPWSKVEEQIAQGRPVWVITSINFMPVPASQWVNWHTREGNIRISYMEHSVLVTGYGEKFVTINNPLSSEGGSQVDKSDFIAAWEQFGSQAITYGPAK